MVLSTLQKITFINTVDGSSLWAREGTIINNCRHLAVVKAAQGSIVLKSYLTNFVLRIYRHLEDVGSCIRIYRAE